MMELRRSPSTIESYRYSVRRFRAFLVTKGLPKPTADLVNDWMVELKRTGNSPRSIARHLFALRDWGEFSGIDLSDVEAPVYDEKTPRVLSEEQIVRLVEKNPRARDLALITLLYDSGIRIGELVQLRWNDVDFDRKQLRVPREKRRGGIRHDVVPLDGFTLQQLRTWKLMRKPAGTHPLFPRADSREPVAKKTIRAWLSAAGRKAGISGLHPHMLRHSRATNILREDPSALYHIKTLLGHKSINTTQRYLHLTGGDLRERIPGAFAFRSEGAPVATKKTPKKDG